MSTIFEQTQQQFSSQFALVFRGAWVQTHHVRTQSSGTAVERSDMSCWRDPCLRCDPIDTGDSRGRKRQAKTTYNERHASRHATPNGRETSTEHGTDAGGSAHRMVPVRRYRHRAGTLPGGVTRAPRAARCRPMPPASRSFRAPRARLHRRPVPPV